MAARRDGPVPSRRPRVAQGHRGARALTPLPSRVDGTGGDMTEVAAELTANVWQVRASVGDELDEGDEIVVLEAMKMEVPVVAPRAGRLVELRVAPDDVVNEGDVIAVLA